MPLLFSYGTLLQEDIQLATFGRLLQGEWDELPGFERSRTKIMDPEVVAATGKTHYPNVTFNGRSESRVRGKVFETTDTELTAADEYEEPAGYERAILVLASGKRAWVYFNKTSTEPEA